MSAEETTGAIAALVVFFVVIAIKGSSDTEIAVTTKIRLVSQTLPPDLSR